MTPPELIIVPWRISPATARVVPSAIPHKGSDRHVTAHAARQTAFIPSESLYFADHCEVPRIGFEPALTARRLPLWLPPGGLTSSYPHAYSNSFKQPGAPSTSSVPVHLSADYRKVVRLDCARRGSLWVSREPHGHRRFVISLLRELARVRQARPRCLRACRGVAVKTVGSPPHRARGHAIAVT